MQSLSVKYRPTNFNDVLGQDSIKMILTKQIESNNIRNCYLFCGPSGDGKTTCARIFATMLNAGQGTPIEIDAASNNGVDNVRAIINSANERAIDAKYKIYIIDECHSITNQGWQAFLKCIEEPPEYTIFIFCTTDPQKIPLTIMNRMMRFNFTRPSFEKISNRLKEICKSENFINYESSCDYIARMSEGCVRDAISLLDKSAAFSMDLNIKNVMSAIGTFSYDYKDNKLVESKEIIYENKTVYYDVKDYEADDNIYQLPFGVDYVIEKECAKSGTMETTYILGRYTWKNASYTEVTGWTEAYNTSENIRLKIHSMHVQEVYLENGKVQLYFLETGGHTSEKYRQQLQGKYFIQ